MSWTDYSPPSPGKPQSIDVQVADEQEISSLLTTTPVYAVLRAVTYLEFAVRDLAGDLGIKEATTADWLSLCRTLVQKQALASEAFTALAELARLRNRIAHQPEEPDAREIAMATDGALALLRGLREIPRSVNRAYKAVPVYRNDVATDAHSTVKGLLVCSFEEPGSESHLSIFAYMGSYETGSRLSFEWDVTRVAKQAWYRNPVTGHPLKAWDRAAIFVGVTLPETENATRYWVREPWFWAVRTRWTIETFDDPDLLKEATGAADVRRGSAGVWSLFHVVDAPNERMADVLVRESVAATLAAKQVPALFMDSYVYPSSPPQVEHRL